MSETSNEGLGPSYRSTSKRCEFVYEVETALRSVTHECRLANAVEISYEIRDGEGFIRIVSVEDKADAKAYRALRKLFSRPDQMRLDIAPVWDSRNIGQ